MILIEINKITGQHLINSEFLTENNITDSDENGNRIQYTLDGFGQISNVTENYNDPFIFVNESYVTSYRYDTNGNLVKITDTLGNQFKFGYDSLGRKISMDDPDLGHWVYKYDQNGNLIFQSGGGGNLISGDGYYREYDGNGRLLKVRSGSLSTSPLLEEYSYDQDGIRIKMVRNDTANTKVYTPFKELLRVTNNTGTYDFVYAYQDGQLVARKNPDGTTYFYQDDHLGSTSVITNGSGSVLENTYYLPYGEELSGGNLDVKGYTGQFDDEATGQMYYGARYYVPSKGIFAQADSDLPSVFDPQQLNRYSYARNNPYAFADDSGHRITYAVENYGGGDQVSIYQDKSYVGRVTSETVTTTDFGSGFSTTTYDYNVQSGYKTVGSNNAMDIADAPSPEQRLSDIVANDRQRLLKDENLEYIPAIEEDILTSGLLKLPKLLRFAEKAEKGYSFITADTIKEKVSAFLPSTVDLYLNQNKGYQAYHKIPEFKGFSKSESNTISNGGSVKKSGATYTTIPYNGKMAGVKITPIR